MFDPSGFPKPGRESVGVARPWCGRLGKTDNCQDAVPLGSVSKHEHALVDMRLYLPEEWTTDAARMKKVGVPRGTKFRTWLQRVLEMPAKHRATQPHQWITGDDVRGRPSWFRRDLRALGGQYLFAVPGNTSTRDLNASIRDLEVEPSEGTGVGRPPKLRGKASRHGRRLNPTPRGPRSTGATARRTTPRGGVETPRPHAQRETARVS